MSAFGNSEPLNEWISEILALQYNKGGNLIMDLMQAFSKGLASLNPKNDVLLTGIYSHLYGMQGRESSEDFELYWLATEFCLESRRYFDTDYLVSLESQERILFSKCYSRLLETLYSGYVRRENFGRSAYTYLHYRLNKSFYELCKQEGIELDFDGNIPLESL